MRATITAGLLLFAVTGCSSQTPPARQSADCTAVGTASWYHGVVRGRTSPDEFGAAHRTLPLGTMVQVTAVETERSVVVRINDRGPFSKDRIIDLSSAAAERLGMRREGVIPVRLTVDRPAQATCPL